jgi:hypothetical protein
MCAGRHLSVCRIEAAFEAWRDGYSVREYASELTAPSQRGVKRAAEEDWGKRRWR